MASRLKCGAQGNQSIKARLISLFGLYSLAKLFSSAASATSVARTARASRAAVDDNLTAMKLPSSTITTIRMIERVLIEALSLICAPRGPPELTNRHPPRCPMCGKALQSVRSSVYLNTSHLTPISAARPPVHRSRPGPPFSLSLPASPNSLSRPGPPNIRSLPEPPQMTSSPPIPRMTSFPPSPWITSGPPVPMMMSLPSVPTMVAAKPLHRSVLGTTGTTVSRSIQFSPFVGIENSPSPWLSRRLLGAHQAGFELLFEPVGVAADIQGDGMVQDAV